MKHRTSRRIPLFAAMAAGCMLAASCTSTGGDSPSPAAGSGDMPQPGVVNVAKAQSKPSAGGTLNISLYSSPPSLDPATAYGTLSTSGIPMAAVYGVLMRYDPGSGKYEPKLAKSLSHGKDFTTWTLKLRQGVKFSDGTPLNADAVVSNLKRIAKQNKTTIAPIVKKMIGGYDTPDTHTVVFHLTKSWSRFPFLLATNGGMVVSPKAVQERGKKFGQHPAGAGPFTVQSFSPDEDIVMARNPDYWGGHVHLDKVRFTHITGGNATADRFRSGEIQMGVTVDPEVVNSMVHDGTPGYLVYNHVGGWVSNQNKGHPTTDPRVRQAIAAATNVKQLNQRAANGKAPFHRTLFPKTSPWDSGKPGVSYDLDKARKLVKQAKQDTGWDGSLNLLVVQAQQRQWQEAITLQGQLNAVGFKVHLTGVQNINELIRHVFVKKDYDLAYWVVTAWNAAPWAALYTNLYSKSARNPYGYASPEFDKLLGDLRSAPSPQDGKQVIGRMQKLWTKDQPMLLDKSSDNLVFWNKKVHGVAPTSLGNVLLDDAYLE